jgi:alpha-ketoglutarate-dependent taurine dioxygenase
MWSMLVKGPCHAETSTNERTRGSCHAATSSVTTVRRIFEHFSFRTGGLSFPGLDVGARSFERGDARPRGYRQIFRQTPPSPFGRRVPTMAADSRLNTCGEALMQAERPRSEAGRRQRLESLPTIEPTPIEPGGVQVRPLREGGKLPVVLTPTTSGLDVVPWATEHRSDVAALLREHGAVLFRGFGALDERVFQALASAVCGPLFADNGEHERTSASPNVYTPTPYPSQKQLFWHNENSFNHGWPGKICFGCVHRAAEGGETPLVDSRAVAKRVDPGIVRRFQERQVMYVRNYLPGLGLHWSKVFQTEDRHEVEAIARRERIALEWTDGGLKTVAVRPALIRHRETGEPVWFTQTLHWHPACLDPDVREVLLATYGAEGLPRDYRFGDGSLIDDSIVHELVALYRELEVVNPWENGDVAIVDNVLTAHGRNPYAGERRLLVALGDMQTYDDVRALEAV